jgi:hypothetical protein
MQRAHSRTAGWLSTKIRSEHQLCLDSTEEPLYINVHVSLGQIEDLPGGLHAPLRMIPAATRLPGAIDSGESLLNSYGYVSRSGGGTKSSTLTATSLDISTEVRKGFLPVTKT